MVCLLVLQTSTVRRWAKRNAYSAASREGRRSITRIDTATSSDGDPDDVQIDLAVVPRLDAGQCRDRAVDHREVAALAQHLVGALLLGHGRILQRDLVRADACHRCVVARGRVLAARFEREVDGVELHPDRQCCGHLVHAGGQFGRDAVAEELGDVEGFAVGHRGA
jgi:hypothetical protein